MNFIFLLGTAALGLASPVLSFIKARKYVLYSFVFLCLFIPTIYGYMSDNDLFIAGKKCSILDIQLILLVLFIYPLTLNDVSGRNKSSMEIAILLLCLLIVTGFFVGFIRLGRLSGVLNISRIFMFVPVYFAASNILSNPKNVRQFYKMILWATVIVFVFHVLIMLRLYIPPMYEAAEERYQQEQYAAVVRPIMFFGEFFYIVSAGTALCHLKYGSSRKLLCIFVLLISLIGTVFTQTRSLYGAMVLLFLGFFLMGRGKIKALAISLVIILATIGILTFLESRGVRAFSRFEEGIPGYRMSMRAAEFTSIVEVIIENPWGLFIGQGFGATHTVIGRTVTFYHNEYLQSFFSLGVFGLIIYCYIIFSSIFRGAQWCGDKEAALMILPVRIVFFALAGMAFFFTTLWTAKHCALILSLAAISRNSDWLVYQTSSVLDYESADSGLLLPEQYLEDREYVMG